MLVKDRMSHPVITVTPQESLDDAAAIMTREHISRLPVVDKRGKMVGIISEKQIIRYSPSKATTLDVYEIQGAMNRIPVEKVMTRELITITPDTPIEEAARIMVDKEISGIPVVISDSLVGIIAETDLFKAFLEVLGAREPGVRLTVMMPRDPGGLAYLTQAIFQAGGNIISVGSFYGESSDTAEVTLKVDGIPKDKLVELVKSSVMKIVDVR
ncbi:MAG TPA: CBS domain-containing protein [Anaerolineaceae bacterium]